eukprot:TRINITY_DN57686_c0_g1_i1.p1 TRINITY_DN57686_c0_g1~~TRINITY_DN57686_c0_g1_i1.p1  ORF type:complete len:419 (-),score=60.99 TRINITY_DN57686_c0_g1_i1:388-1644(-)
MAHGRPQRQGRGRFTPAAAGESRMLLMRMSVLAFAATNAAAGAKAKEVDACPLPPTVASHRPKVRTALASHPRAGSTWTRYLVEHATGLPCGFEKFDWANVLPHIGEDPDKPYAENKHGILVKTHSACFGCWPDALDSDKVTVKRNTSFSEEELRSLVGEELAESLLSQGACLLTMPHSMQSKLNPGRYNPNRKWAQRVASLPCEFPYDRAVLLFRYPLDNVRSNYHYRTAVLGMRGGSSWAAGDWEFPRERGESWLAFYHSWVEFAKHRPVLWVLYEDMKENPERELRRMINFLDQEHVSDEKVACAVNSSTMEKLQATDRTAKGTSGSQFFGSRKQTEDKEKLSFPPQLLRHFRDIGVFEVARKLGYAVREEEARADLPDEEPPADAADPGYGKGRAGKGRLQMARGGAPVNAQEL